MTYVGFRYLISDSGIFFDFLQYRRELYICRAVYCSNSSVIHLLFTFPIKLFSSISKVSINFCTSTFQEWPNQNNGHAQVDAISSRDLCLTQHQGFQPSFFKMARATTTINCKSSLVASQRQKIEESANSQTKPNQTKPNPTYNPKSEERR